MDKDKKESYQERVSRVATTIENLLNAEGLRMDVVHQVFFRPAQQDVVETPVNDRDEVVEVEKVSAENGEEVK